MPTPQLTAVTLSNLINVLSNVVLALNTANEVKDAYNGNTPPGFITLMDPLVVSLEASRVQTIAVLSAYHI